MANVRLLRQQLSDYQKRTDAEQKAYEDRYANYEQQYGQYEQGVAGYNSAIQKAGAGTPMVVLNGNGTYSLVSGTYRSGNLITQQANLPVSSALADITPSSDNMNNDNNGAPTYGSQYLKNPDGSVSKYDYKPAVMSSDYGGYEPTSWEKTADYGLIPSIPVAPAEATAPAQVKEPNLTVSNYNELKNPGNNPAQMVALANKGLLGKSELAGMEPASKNSAFADPEDPNNLKQQGVLARTLAGQL